MIDTTKPVQTRDGRKARIICTDAKKGERNIVALVDEGDGGETVFTYKNKGHYSNDHDTPHDLVNVPEQRVRYIGVRGPGDTTAAGQDLVFPCDNKLKLTYEGDKLVKAEIFE